MVRLCFTLTQHVRDRAQLERIRNVLGVGKIFHLSPQTLQLRVESQENLVSSPYPDRGMGMKPAGTPPEAVIKHFQMYQSRSKNGQTLSS